MTVEEIKAALSGLILPDDTITIYAYAAEDDIIKVAGDHPLISHTTQAEFNREINKRKSVYLQLILLRAHYSARRSSRQGSVSETSADYERERQIILRQLIMP